MFNVAYSANLVASGGTPAGYKWAVSQGSLPPGLQLSEDGQLSGKPAVVGDFVFTVTVVDSVGDAASMTFTIVVGRKRWLVYVADRDLPGQQLIFAADLASSPPAQTLLSTSVQAKASVLHYEFSPNGRWLAYAVDRATDEVYDLYVVDLSGDSPAAAMKVNAGGSVRGFAWSPDSARLLYHVALSATTGEVHYTDLSSGVPTSPPAIAAFPSPAVGWAGDSIAYFGNSSSADRFNFARWDGETFSSSQQLDAVRIGSLAFAVSHPATSRLAIANYCAPPAYVVDFTDINLVSSNTVTSLTFSPNLRYAVAADQPDTRVFLASALNGDPLATVPVWLEACPTDPGGGADLVPAWGHGSGLIAGRTPQREIALITVNDDGADVQLNRSTSRTTVG
jgi:Tol biopolymer transport system component